MENRHSTGQTGEALVAAELARKGYTIAVPTGNAKDIDILVYKEGRNFAVQVKAISKGALQLNLSKYLDVEFRGDKQIILGIKPKIDKRIWFVVVFLGDKLGEDHFYWTTLGEFSEFLKEKHEGYLNRNNGERPGSNKQSLHAGIKQDAIKSDQRFVSLEAFLDEVS